MVTSSSVTARTGPVLTEAQTKILDTLKAVSRNTGAGLKRTTAEAADAVSISLPALQLAAGSAKATGDLRGARYVANQTKSLADDLRAALKNAAAAPDDVALKAKAPTADQVVTIAKQLKLLLVKARIALLNPLAQQSNPSSQRAAESDVKASEASLKALEAQIAGVGKSGIDIRA